MTLTEAKSSLIGSKSITKQGPINVVDHKKQAVINTPQNQTSEKRIVVEQTYNSLLSSPAVNKSKALGFGVKTPQ